MWELLNILFILFTCRPSKGNRPAQPASREDRSQDDCGPFLPVDWAILDNEEDNELDRCPGPIPARCYASDDDLFMDEVYATEFMEDEEYDNEDNEESDE